MERENTRKDFNKIQKRFIKNNPICCRCGNCCRLKLEDEESGDIYYTDVICRYFDLSNNLCQQYHQRCRLVPECLKLTEQNWNKINWMPTNCAYRILYQTGDLPSWHPLKTKKPLADKYSVKNKQDFLGRKKISTRNPVLKIWMILSQNFGNIKNLKK